MANVRGELTVFPQARAVVLEDEYWALSSSTTVSPVIPESFPDVPGVWSTEPPDWEAGKYMWRVKVTHYTTGDPDISSPVCLSGADGQAGKDAILLRIDSSRGNVFKNNAVSTVLSAVIFYGDRKIETASQLRSTFGSNARIEWQWKPMDSETWGTILSTDSRLSDSGFRFTLSPEDVDVKVVFQCNLVIE